MSLPPPGRRPRACQVGLTLALALVIALLSGGLWQFWNQPLHPPDARLPIAGMAYNAFQRWDSPLQQQFPSDEAIDADLRLLSQYTRRLRTYSSSEFERLPEIAARHGLRLTAGVWLDRRLPANERELEAVQAAVAAHKNIDRVIAGNETLLQDKLKPAQLYEYLDRLRRTLGVPVSTAEPWHVWLDTPELAERVDFITVHLLPYWEGLPIEAAVPYALQRYRELQARFPGKPIVIGEIGWPSGDFRFGAARATPGHQARFVREFLGQAQAMASATGRAGPGSVASAELGPLDYYLMEAVDQPWKATTEGRVGAHWGLFDARRNLKFELQGPIEPDPYWRRHAVAATMLALLPLLPLMLWFPDLRLAGRTAFALSALLVATFAVSVATRPLADYFSPIDLAFYSLLVPALLLMGAIFLAVMLEFSELFWAGSLRHRARPRPHPDPDESQWPWVSIHLACANEPPDMVLTTIRSLCALDWPHLEILIIDNNTQDASRWQPVRDHVQALADPRVRFFHLPRWPGFKAGALNFALEQTDPRARWIGVVDADYEVDPNWIRQLAGYFTQADVAAVQAPQAHRDWEHNTASRLMNWEYEGFFRLGMHHRHERNALIQHGTMILVRREALEQAGRWDPACVCEDAELGLRFLERGQRVVYVDEVLGRGLVPADWESYRRQRRRWAMGGMQILRLHAGALLGRSSPLSRSTPLGRRPLTLAQRYHFIAGWLPWMGDALHLCFSVLALSWTVGLLMAPATFNVPASLLLAPLMLFAGVRLILGPLLYLRRVQCSLRDVVGAALAGMSLSHTIARGVLKGLFSRSLRFEVTTKQSVQATTGPMATPLDGPSPDGPAPAVPHQSLREAPQEVIRSKRRGLIDRFTAQEAGQECALLLGLLLAMAALLLQTRQPLDGALLAWVGVLALQALPYAVTVAVSFGLAQKRPH